MRVSNHDSFGPPQQGPPPFPKTKTVFCIKSHLVSHENKFQIQPPHLSRALLCKSSGNKYFRVRNMGWGKNRGGSSPYHSNLKTSCIVQVLPPAAVVEPCIKIWARTGLVFVALSLFSRIGVEKSQKPSKPLCGPKFVQYLHQESCF